MSARVSVFAAAFAAALAAWTSPGAAPLAAEAAGAPAIRAVVDCTKIAADAQRLACYDTAVAVMARAEASGDLVSLDRAQRNRVRRQMFGLTLPSIELFDHGEGRLHSVRETLSSARQDARGRWTFVMQDGQVWRQIDEEVLSRDPHPGSSVEIREAMLGSFMLSVDGQPAVRAHRDN